MARAEGRRAGAAAARRAQERESVGWKRRPAQTREREREPEHKKLREVAGLK
jgi:hypothetical protein